MKQHELTEEEERYAGLMYNALYMLDWQIGRARAGVWDDYTLDLLEMGAATAARLHANNQSFGKFGLREIRQLRDDAWQLISERHS